MACLKLYLVRRQVRQKNSSKTSLKNDQNTKFQLYHWKVSANAKIAIQCLKISWGANAPLVARLIKMLSYSYD